MKISDTRIAILGTGNIGSAIARGLVSATLLPAGRISLTRRKPEGLSEFRRDGYLVGTDNTEALRNADLVILAVTPQQLNALLTEIRGVLDPRRHTVVSVVSGATIAEMRRQLGGELAIIRAMPNTAIAIRESMTCLSTDIGNAGALALVKTIFDSLGKSLVIDEALMVPATALCACGIAFFLRSIRAASQGGDRDRVPRGGGIADGGTNGQGGPLPFLQVQAAIPSGKWTRSRHRRDARSQD